MEVFLRRWWTRKYSRPWTSKEFSQHNIFELLLEYYEDMYEKDNLEAYKDEDGNVVFDETGDPLIDKWEAELAKGLQPDLTEGLSHDQLGMLDKEKSKADRARSISKDLDNIDDSFLEDPRYQTKSMPKEVGRHTSTKGIGLLDKKDILGSG
jgi:hypothetical protein